MVEVVLAKDMRPPRGLLHPSTDNLCRRMAPNLGVLRAILAFSAPDSDMRPALEGVQWDIATGRLSAANGYTAAQVWCSGNMASLDDETHSVLDLLKGDIRLSARDLRAIRGRAGDSVMLHSCERTSLLSHVDGKDVMLPGPVSVFWLQVGRGIWPVHNDAAGTGPGYASPNIDTVFDKFGMKLGAEFPHSPGRIALDPVFLDLIVGLAKALSPKGKGERRNNPTLEFYLGGPSHPLQVYMAYRGALAGRTRLQWDAKPKTLARCAVMPVHLRDETAWLLPKEYEGQEADDAEGT